ncbi:MAG: PTS sugar transporter subunit IIB [Solobacterium sp.]|jgi:PTS system N-acetylgalactosamine-specific IIB component|nr:PTS sugar transporter subunit IIB [Solobacterium sp.]MCH4047859.1 PTS sugar transporter subunit IIB [Solobacterium sp.]MCH4075555.1 PTS sugar transporter subunit IIB [Solobacterium sp.]MCI1313249.1 PTS sugar transporter subunit IIB [Solobacterium sp.]MCI1346019.1 PTS sugar transporter subunit IIB [Solobacterium sp.]
MADIVLCRIDERLVHGQITAQWIGYLGLDSIVVADREAAASNFRQGLMDMAVPNSVETHYWSPEETIIRLKDDDSQKRTLLLVKSPAVLLQLLRGGIQIAEADVGLMEKKDNTVQVDTQVFVSEDDRDAFRKIKEMGTVLYIQALPYEEKKDDSILLK